MTNRRQLLDVSWETILKIFLAGLFFYLLYLARDIVIWAVFGLVISLLLNPAINLLKKLRIPRILAAILVYLSIFGVLGVIVYLTAPIFAFEIKQFSQSLPQYFEELNPYLESLGIEVQKQLQNLTLNLTDRLKEISAGVFSALSVIFGGILSTFFILFTAFFISLEEGGVERLLKLFFPKKYEDYALEVFRRCQIKVSGWFGARILSCTFVGVATFLVLLLFEIKYAFILALFVGILSFIPYLGALVAAVLLFLSVLVTSSWWKAVFGLIGFGIIQQIENYIITPILTKKFIGLPPVIVLIALAVGGKIFGVLGAIFAIPIAGILYEFLKDFLKKKKEKDQMDTAEVL